MVVGLFGPLAVTNGRTVACSVSFTLTLPTLGVVAILVVPLRLPSISGSAVMRHALVVALQLRLSHSG